MRSRARVTGTWIAGVGGGVGVRIAGADEGVGVRIPGWRPAKPVAVGAASAGFGALGSGSPGSPRVRGPDVPWSHEYRPRPRAA